MNSYFFYFSLKDNSLIDTVGERRPYNPMYIAYTQ